MRAPLLLISSIVLLLCYVRLVDGAAKIQRSGRPGVHAPLKGSDPYPWWTGVELGTAGGSPQIEAFLSFTCPDCRHHYEGILKPLLKKFGHKISVVHQPFALPFQDYSHDAVLAAYSVYRLSNNSVEAWTTYIEKIFTNQDIFFNCYELSQRQVWHEYFGKWANEQGILTHDLISAMNGTVTTANYDAWYAANYARQRTFAGAPQFIINRWLPVELDLPSWNLTRWEAWITSALGSTSGGAATTPKGGDL